jgi:DeoR/GlpR family transcriptional regulator of sugar metabolism
MLPIERKQQILTWLQKEGTLRISDISERLEVSEMTVYRDVASLVKEQRVHKTSNGVAILDLETSNPKGCSYCAKPINSRLAVQLILTNHQVEQTCCMHCGLLRYNEIESKTSQIICHDFLKDTTISAKRAYFLMEANAHLNCCQPEVLVFDSHKQAQQFQQGFGGELTTFEEARIAIEKSMNGHGCHDSH